MNFIRKTIFWVIILVVLGGGFYLIDRRVEDVRRAKEASMRLFPFEPEDVVEFWIRNGEEKIHLVRKNEEWWLKEPLSAKGDKETLEPLLRNVVKAKRDAVLFEEPSALKLKELGLESPQVEMGFKTERGSIALLFGDKAPAHNVAYAMFKGDQKVYRIHSDVKKEASRSVYDLRDKTILSFDPLKVRRFELERKGRERIVIEQSIEGKWDIVEPVKERVEMNEILKTLYGLKNAKIKAFIEEEPPDISRYGLKAPDIKVSILERDKESKLTLLIGRRDRIQRGYFAKRDSVSNVFLVEEDLVNSLLLDSDKWREG